MHTLPELQYDYTALEPHIDAKTMEIHHTKHHQGYVNKLNAALESHSELQEKSIEELLIDLESLPDDIKTAIRNNGGGHYNHSLFWKIMSPDGGGEPVGDVAEKIMATFGDGKSFMETFNEAAATRFGSGWAWLIADKEGNLRIDSTANQDTPLSADEKPILGLDVWEHAYYLNYQNKRPDYVGAWWNLVNWNQVEENYQNR